MRELTQEELKKIQLEILDVTAAFCEAHGIQYWLDSGTLIGAIRHNGYIPWDDDIDLGMLRPDYDRFLQLFNIENTRYKAYSVENNREFLFPYAKVLDCSTVLYEPDESGLKLSVNIDIIVYDNAPDNDDLVKQMYDRRDALRMWHQRRLYAGSYGSILRKMVKQIMLFPLKVFPPYYFAEKMVENAKAFVNADTKRVGNFSGWARMACDKHVFDSFIEHEFEGKRYKIPIGYDEWLRAFYGNYMELPPVEKRVSHHLFKGYCPE